MKDLGEAKKILGMEITRDRAKGLVSLNQRQYLEKLIRKFGVHDSTKPRDDSGIGHFAVGYVDSDYAGDLDGRKSTTGYVFTMAKGPVCWRSILQSSVALSTTEAEYMAVAEAIKEAIWIHGLIRDLGVDQKQVEVHCDSQSAIYLAKYQVHHARTKHIDVRYHFIRGIVGEGEIILQKIPTKDNTADMLTKVVGVAKFVHCLNLAHILPI
ncbi:hypothetical protein ACFX19_027172 [Malus domestica]